MITFYYYCDVRLYIYLAAQCLSLRGNVATNARLCRHRDNADTGLCQVRVNLHTFKSTKFYLLASAFIFPCHALD